MCRYRYLTPILTIKLKKSIFVLTFVTQSIVKSVSMTNCLIVLDHHRKKQQEKEKERQQEQEKMQQMLYGSPRVIQSRSPRQFSPRFPSPRQQGGIRSPGMRHEPYPVGRPVRRPAPLNLEQRMPNPRAAGAKAAGLDGQTIKIEPDDDDGSNQSASDTNAQTGSTPGAGNSASSPSQGQPSTPLNVKSESGGEKDDDNQSESSTGTIPTMPAEGLSLDSDLSNIVSEQTGGEGDTSLDPNVSVKLEALTDAEMELEITGVEPGRAPVSLPQDWGGNVSAGMNYDPSGATGTSADMTGSPAGFSK